MNLSNSFPEQEASAALFQLSLVAQELQENFYETASFSTLPDYDYGATLNRNILYGVFISYLAVLDKMLKTLTNFNREQLLLFLWSC